MLERDSLKVHCVPAALAALAVLVPLGRTSRCLGADPIPKSFYDFHPGAPVVLKIKPGPLPMRTPPKPRAGLYGEPRKKPSADIREAFDRSILRSRPWEGKDFYVIQTALHPGLLIRAKSDRLVLFHKLSDWGLGQPSFLIFREKDRTIAVREGFEGVRMTRSWFIASFAGSAGWTDWDAPWLIALQKRPAKIENSADGLIITFPGKDTGYVMAMPLFGYYKPPQKGREFLRSAGLPDPGIQTWRWAEEGLPEPLCKLADFWAGTARAFPLAMEETFSVDRLLDTITFKQKHDYLENADDWGTTPVKFAALPPTLGLAYLGSTFPMEISALITDPHCMTALGPFLGVTGRDEFTYTMHVLQYVNETERKLLPDASGATTDARIATEALKLLRNIMAAKFPRPSIPGPYDHGGMQNYCWCIMGDYWYAKAIPYLEEPTASNVKSSLKRYFEEVVLNEANYTPFKGKFLLHGPGIGSWGGWDDAGKFAMNTIRSIWAYGHYTGDWELLEKKWDFIKRLNIHTEEMEWAGVGRSTIAEMGDKAEPAIALARIAWRLGDVDEYNYACYVAAKELVHHYVMQVGAEYFKKRQPFHAMGRMGERVYLTNYWGSTAGWQIDGLEWAYGEGEHQAWNRWVRFHSEDVGRFYRDVLAAEVRAELDAPETRRYFERDGHIKKDDSHILPSFVRVRGLVLGESASKLAEIARPSEIEGPDSGKVASYFAYIRGGCPVQQERLVPASGRPTPFVPGRSREDTEGLESMCVHIRTGTRDWPLPVWHFWKPPKELEPDKYHIKGAWPFGFIRPAVELSAGDGEVWSLGWTGRVIGLNAAKP